MLDFLTDYVSINADGGHVLAKRTNLRPFTESLPSLAGELRELCCQRATQTLAPAEVSAPTSEQAHITLSRDGSKVIVNLKTDVDKFIRQITRLFIEIEKVLEQAARIGSGIKRRPYSEYIEEIAKTGFAQVEAHGSALFLDGHDAQKQWRR